MVRLCLLAVLIALPWTSTSTAGEAKPQYLIGQLLVAAPSMPDGRFAGTVIYMCEHSADGALGLVINRSLAKMPAEMIAENFGLDAGAAEGAVNVVWGGPVEFGRGFVLHSTDHMGAGSLRTGEGLAYSSNPQMLIDVLEGHGPSKALLALGYAGWGAGQLESEIARDDWLTVPADAAFVFDSVPDEMWRAAMDQYSIEL